MIATLQPPPPPTSQPQAPAIDRRSTEHTADFHGDFIFTNTEEQDAHFVILRLADGTRALGNESPDFFARYQRYRFFGRWEEDVKGGRGLQFRFSTVTRDEPLSREGVIKYLTDIAEHVGKATARKLWDAYGSCAVQILREDPARVAREEIMSYHDARDAADQLEKYKRTERTKIELSGLFEGRGFHGKAYNACISKWGAKAPAVIRRDPFKLLTASIPSAGFKRCDKLWTDLRLEPARLKRQMICGWNAMRTARDGHTWFTRGFVKDAIQMGIRSDDVDADKAITLGLRARWMREYVDADGKRWLAETAKATAEQRVADSIARLLTAPPAWPINALPISQSEGDGLPSQHQITLARAACSTAFGVLAGTPGTGKTFTLAFLLREIIARNPEGVGSIAVCAPTGKAAVRSTQAMAAIGLPLRATTIHSLLEIEKAGYGNGERWGFTYNRKNPLPHRYVIVDESSMVDADLMADLLDACQTGTHVLLIGDPYQLPPVGHGAPLRDVIASGRVGYGELTEVRRNAGLIVHACKAIKCGEPIECSDRIDLAPADPLAMPLNLKLFETRNAAQSGEMLEKLIGAFTKFDPLWQTQVIVALNDKSAVSRSALNARLSRLLNPNGLELPKLQFRVGDKVICLKNSWFVVVNAPQDWRRAEMAAEVLTNAKNYRASAKERYTANGEIGKVVAIAPGAMVVKIGTGDELIAVHVGKAKTNEDGDSEGGSGSAWDLAYAVTCHKMQGSEAPCVIVMLDEAAGSVAKREWVYTALSRAAKLCLLIGSRETLEKQARAVALTRRKTHLRELIQGAAK